MPDVLESRPRVQSHRRFSLRLVLDPDDENDPRSRIRRGVRRQAADPVRCTTWSPILRFCCERTPFHTDNVLTYSKAARRRRNQEVLGKKTSHGARRTTAGDAETQTEFGDDRAGSFRSIRPTLDRHILAPWQMCLEALKALLPDPPSLSMDARGESDRGPSSGGGSSRVLGFPTIRFPSLWIGLSQERDNIGAPDEPRPGRIPGEIHAIATATPLEGPLEPNGPRPMDDVPVSPWPSVRCSMKADHTADAATPSRPPRAGLAHLKNP